MSSNEEKFDPARLVEEALASDTVTCATCAAAMPLGFIVGDSEADRERAHRVLLAHRWRVEGFSPSKMPFSARVYCPLCAVGRIPAPRVDEAGETLRAKLGESPRSPFESSIAEMAEKAAALAARAVGTGLAHVIRVYVPPALVTRFAIDLAEELLDEVHRFGPGSAARVPLRDVN